MISSPPPFPSSWYCLGLSKQLRPGQILSRRFAGADVVVFRTESGSVSVMDAICPHLGAHLGGGRIERESIECPFHHFRYDRGGQCVATGYGTRPPKIALPTWPVDEKNGFILAYHGPTPPDWTVPEIETAGWTPLLTRTWTQRGHPQETTENSVDFGHFATMHGFEDVEEVRAAETTGACLRAIYRMRRPVKLAGRTLGAFAVEFDVRVHGLGYSIVETTLPEFGLALRHFILSCPVEEETIELRVGLTIERVPIAFVDRILPHLFFHEFCRDVGRDLINWQTKRYMPRPILVQGDGPIRTYRRWAEQFYTKVAT